jgi:hypothetical protein
MNPWKLSTVALSAVLVTGGLFVGTAGAEQTHMEKALTALKAAKAALEAAKHDHGGHRTSALKATETAINEVQEGIAWAEKHPGAGKEPGGSKGDPGGSKGDPGTGKGAGAKGTSTSKGGVGPTKSN